MAGKSFTAIKDELNKGKRQYQAFADAEDTIAALEAAEQSSAELTKQIKDKSDELSKVSSKLDAANKKVDDAEAEAKQIVDDAKSQGEQIVAKANQDAGEIRGNIDAAVEVAESDLKKAKDQLAKLNAQIDNKQAEVTSLNDQVAKQKAALAGALSNLEG